MLFLSGAITQTLLADVRADVGLMVQPGMGNSSLPLQFRAWAGDNGRYAAPERWNAGDWLEWAAGLRRYRQNCLFMVAPDVVGDAEATFTLSCPYLPTIRQFGFKAAYVSQDGADDTSLPWDEFDCLFVGGTSDWKLSEASHELAVEAKTRGKWVHMGRVSTWGRIRTARILAFDSVDSTYLKYGPDVNWPTLCNWLDSLTRDQQVFGF